jgi:hypothetical protein
MKQSEVDWKGGEVVFWGIDDLHLNKAIEPQIEDVLREDLIMVQYGDKIILDLGWYPSFNLDGQFVLNVVESKYQTSQDWDSPVFRTEFRDLDALKSNLDRAIQVAVAASDV